MKSEKKSGKVRNVLLMWWIQEKVMFVVMLLVLLFNLAIPLLVVNHFHSELLLVGLIDGLIVQILYHDYKKANSITD